MSDSGAIPEELAPRRQRMLDCDLAGRDITSAAVLAAMGRVRREEFLPASLRVHAYDDTPLRIGSGQTISQPYVVAFMSQALRVEPDMKVLEIGTGSGYQTAVLVELGAEVFTIERHDELSLAAESVLDRLGYGGRVTLLTEDGTLGWPEEAPFDRILVTAAGPAVPQSLAEQLREGGLLVMPVGDYREDQHLLLVEKWDGRLVETPLLDVRFVPLVGREGFGGNEE
jgi:protein-L-isoaspartate(D-aspartate) O-methyltransferase